MSRREGRSLSRRWKPNEVKTVSFTSFEVGFLRRNCRPIEFDMTWFCGEYRVLCGVREHGDRAIVNTGWESLLPNYVVRISRGRQKSYHLSSGLHYSWCRWSLFDSNWILNRSIVSTIFEWIDSKSFVMAHSIDLLEVHKCAPNVWLRSQKLSSLTTTLLKFQASVFTCV